MVQTYIILSNRIYSLKYLRSSTLDYKDIEIRKSKLVAEAQYISAVVLNIKGCKAKRPIVENRFTYVLSYF